jgi:hypothetical protein
MYQGLSSGERGNSLGSLHLLCDMKYLLSWINVIVPLCTEIY